MAINESWEKAVRNTQVIKNRLAKLETFKLTELQYIFLAESEVNIGDTVIRKGVINVDKPMIFLPEGSPQFYGFDFEKEMSVNTETLKNFLIMRGIVFPSLKYNHVTSSLELFENSLTNAIRNYSDELAKKEDIETGLIVGPADTWQFSVLIYVATLVIKSLPSDIKQIIDRLLKNDK
ncbi:MAG: hypothetical protein AUJ85_06595 [Elusimicrobia bacterium CG1_02_37_114]|nr:MAG: hypothetical protein AUJ85_06595 [Elusimicrobia bacterium CG1_02_37_114]PIV53876.1 MAG: hypothetical protein COS17_01540 [Elusimicrobia bacterium CG02_land_8_20_14_3_00_37_13]